MINLNAILQAAHNGEAMNTLAEQFGISPEAAQEAVQSLLPAVSMGLQQQMSNGGLGQILGHLATPQNIAAWEDPEAAQSDDTIAAGSDALNYLFGREDVAVRVAEHAAEHSSLGSELLQSMLPVVAAMVMGGLFKSIAAKGGLGGLFGGGAAAPQTQPESGGGVGDILGQMTGRQSPAPAPRESSGGIGDILGQITGGGQQPPQPRAQAPRGDGGINDMLDRISAPRGGAAPQQSGGGLGDILGQLTGAQRGQAPQTGGGGLGDLLGSILGGGQTSRGAAPQGGGGLGDLLGGLFGGGHPPQAGAQTRPQAGPGGIDPAALQAGLEQLTNMFGPGAKVSPKQQSGLDGILGQILGGGRR